MTPSLFQLFSILLVWVATVTAVYDVHFCVTNIGPINSTGYRQQKPVFFDNFYVLSESKDDYRSMSNSEMYYSAQSGQVYGSTIANTFSNQMWMNSQYDEVMMAPMDRSSSCVGVAFDKSPLLTITRSQVVDGSVVLASPYVLFGWDDSIQRNLSYLGDSQARGIATQRWITCEYYPILDITYVITWDIVDSSKVFLPVVSPTDAEFVPVLPVRSSTKMKNGTGYETRINMDYTHWAHINQNDRHFQIPADMLCANKPNSQKPLPVIPDYFRFRAEQITFNGYNTKTPQAPDLVSTTAEYRKIMGLYIQEFITTPQRGNPNDKSFIRVVDDYNTGVSYTLDLTSGACVVTSISGTGKDAYQLASGLVRMRSSDEFFDLDSKSYQYMGTHRMREIDCDTWSAQMTDNKPDHSQNTLYTWYFASADWQTKNNYHTPGTIPVMLQLEQNNLMVQFHVYEFATDPNKWLPDLSTCYNSNNTMNIEIFLKGRFDQFYSSGPGYFKQNFIGAFVGATQLPSPLRINDIDIQPANGNEIVVRFKLLDQLNVAGDVGTTPDKVPSKTILDRLVKSVNAGQFMVDVGVDGKTQLYARPGSAAVTENKGKFQFVAAQPSSGGYSAGSMAGIGVGMVVLGLVLGVVVIFLVKKFRKSGDDTIAMSSSS